MKSKASVLTSGIATIGNSFFFLGSRLGDSLLVQYSRGSSIMTSSHVKDEASPYEGHHLMFYRMLLVVRSSLCILQPQIAQNQHRMLLVMRSSLYILQPQIAQYQQGYCSIKCGFCCIICVG
ncbi:putative WD40/YVTN repeat-like-containing domain superfamily [Dioscorea sansibarensis]